MNSLNDACKKPDFVENTGVQTMPKSSSASDMDVFEKQNNKNKTDKKRILILGSIISAAILLGIGIKSGKLKQLFRSFSSKTPQNSAKTSPTNGKLPTNTEKTAANTEKITSEQTQAPKGMEEEVKTQAPKPMETKAEAQQTHIQTPKTTEQKAERQIKQQKTPKPDSGKKDESQTTPGKKPIRIKFLTKPNEHRIKIINRPDSTEKPAASRQNGRMIVQRRPPKRVQMLGERAIQALLSKENITTEDLQHIQTIFKNNTKVNLYCPEIHHINDFKPFFNLIFDGKFYQRMDPEIKHIIIGHGIGSAKQDNWRFIGTRENIFDFIERNIPKGDTVLVMSCEETANRIKPGVGTTVNITLQQADRPGKIVRSGERRIIGKITQDEPKIQYF